MITSDLTQEKNMFSKNGVKEKVGNFSKISQNGKVMPKPMAMLGQQNPNNNPMLGIQYPNKNPTLGIQYPNSNPTLGIQYPNNNPI